MLLQDSGVQHAELQHTSGQGTSKHAQVQLMQQQDGAQEFKYTLGAARRTELRRLRSFVKMADYMMCDTLQQVPSVKSHSIANLASKQPSCWFMPVTGQLVKLQES